MKALVLKEYNLFTVEDVPMPQFGNNDILIRVQACSICGSDIHGMDGSTGRRIPPIIMGHEASGVVEMVGSNVLNFKPGDRVTFDSTVYCGSCDYCRAGQVNLCDNRKVLGVSCGDYKLNGAFAEYVAVPQHIVYAMPDNISFEQAAMVEPLSVALHAVKRCNISVNDTALVVGAGMIGLLVIQLLKAAGCATVIAADILQNKLEMAKKFGADIILNSNEMDVPSEVGKITKNKGADLAFEVVGMASSLNTAIESVKKGGSVILVGNLKKTVDFPLQSVVTRQITLFGSCASSLDYGDCLDLISSQRVDVESFISAVAPLDEGAEWFKRLYNKEASLMKVILKP
jgi:L-iditol 2-dehydrogenase